ncbi:MAG: type II toxin-antitoxin system RelE/ParE family toxin [Acidobacteria bacterium]|nr:type II toxin-antitoxin system RelE/ParE family toxin [Acidobacteriota bacterium]
MSQCLLSPAAVRDLREIQAYIARDSIDASRRVVTQLRTACERLARNPLMGHSREDLTDQPVLFWPVGAYSVIYRPETTPLKIVRVLHGSRDIPNLV